MTLIASYTMLFLFGVLIGNFTTTVFHRLPRNIMVCGFDQISTRPPFCSNCGHILRFYEYLPILSWVSTCGRCNYCYISITKSYIVLEILAGLAAMILYYLIGQNLEYFFIYFCFSALAFLNIFIYLEHSFVPIKITLGIIILGVIYRTLIDQEIFLWIANLSCASILSLWIIKDSFNYESATNEASAKESLVHLILPASLWCQNYGILLFAASTFFWYFFSKTTMKKLFYPLCLISLFLISLLYVKVI